MKRDQPDQFQALGKIEHTHLVGCQHGGRVRDQRKDTIEKKALLNCAERTQEDWQPKNDVESTLSDRNLALLVNRQQGIKRTWAKMVDCVVRSVGPHLDGVIAVLHVGEDIHVTLNH